MPEYGGMSCFLENELCRPCGDDRRGWSGVAVCCASFAVRTGRDGISLAGRFRFVTESSGEYVVAFVGMLARAGALVTLATL